jgi:hypothetical protein
MKTFNVIEFHRTRDFSRKLNATFEFVKQNFKPLSKSILLIAGPSVLIAGVLMGSLMSEFNVFSTLGRAGQAEDLELRFSSISFWLEIVLMMIFYTLAAVMNVATVYNYMVLYDEKKSNVIQVSEVWARVRATFWMYFRSIAACSSSCCCF